MQKLCNRRVFSLFLVKTEDISENEVKLIFFKTEIAKCQGEKQEKRVVI